MSKRTRGTRRNPHQRPARRAPARAGRSQLETAEVAAEAIEHGDYALAAHELELAEAAEIVQAPEPRRRERTAAAGRAPSGTIAARAASEYVYVGQDLRRIAVVAAILFGVMGVFFVLFQVLGVLRL